MFFFFKVIRQQQLLRHIYESLFGRNTHVVQAVYIPSVLDINFHIYNVFVFVPLFMDASEGSSCAISLDSWALSYYRHFLNGVIFPGAVRL